MLVTWSEWYFTAWIYVASWIVFAVQGLLKYGFVIFKYITPDSIWGWRVMFSLCISKCKMSLKFQTFKLKTSKMYQKSKSNCTSGYLNSPECYNYVKNVSINFIHAVRIETCLCLLWLQCSANLQWDSHFTCPAVQGGRSRGFHCNSFIV